MVSDLVTAQDDEAYRKFVTHHAIELSKSRMPVNKLHHYTTGENLISIIKSGSIWSSQIARLNDEKEFLHACEVFAEVIANAKPKYTDDQFLLVLEELEERLQQTNPESAGIFVTCFSKVHDDLSQWRAYGGYSVDFDFDQLRGAAAKQNLHLVPVIYQEPIKQSFLNDVIVWTKRFFEEGIKTKNIQCIEPWVTQFVDRWLEHLTFFAPILKHPSFEGEAEWRLVRPLMKDDVSSMEFRERHSMMTRHLPLSFSKSKTEDFSHLPFEGITVGPKANKSLTKVSVADLLVSQGYDLAKIDVRLSKIPYRSS